jgi:hypothetical protein
MPEQPGGLVAEVLARRQVVMGRWPSSLREFAGGGVDDADVQLPASKRAGPCPERSDQVPPAALLDECLRVA